MRKLIKRFSLLVPAVFICCVLATGPALADPLTVTDGTGRKLTVPKCPGHVICSGAGCLRLITYLESQDKIVAVDNIEKRATGFEARPYALANPQFKNYPLFGEFRGHDNPEQIIQPQVIFKTFGTMGYDPAELQKKTGIPVVVLNYGDFFGYQKDLYESIRIMGKILCKEKRAEEVIAFFDAAIADLDGRTADIEEPDKKSCYVGGISFKGPLDFRSTEPAYPPFMFTHSKHVAYDPESPLSYITHTSVAKEKIIEWDPDIAFADLSSVLSAPDANVLNELKDDPAYRQLRAVKSGEVYGVVPFQQCHSFPTVSFLSNSVIPFQQCHSCESRNPLMKQRILPHSVITPKHSLNGIFLLTML